MVKTLYALTDSEKDILSRLDQSDVIATGPWRKGDGTMPHRAVIRDLGGLLVVHNQIVGESTAFYAQGAYLHHVSGVNTLEVALDRFNDRVRKHHHIDTFTRQ